MDVSASLFLLALVSCLQQKIIESSMLGGAGDPWLVGT